VGGPADPAAGTITSPRAAPVAVARRLAKRGLRDAAGAFLVEGPQPVREALADPRRLVTDVFVTHAAADRHPELTAAAGRGGAVLRLVTTEVLAALAQTVTPQGVVAVARFCDAPLAAVFAPGLRLGCLLAAVRDPGNAGTLVRSADAAGAGGVVFAADSVDPYNGKCVRASAGSLFHLPFAAGGPLADACAAARGAGARVYAAAATGPEDLDRLADAGELAAPTVWLFGNEAWGLPEPARGLADRVVRVPIHGRAESLNLAAAAVVCLYASAKAQRPAGPAAPAGSGL
jgi:TrmH family RNA methyltransferase